MDQDVYKFSIGRKNVRNMLFTLLLAIVVFLFAKRFDKEWDGISLHYPSPGAVLWGAIIGIPLTHITVRIDKYGVRITYAFVLHRRVLWEEIRSIEFFEDNRILIILNGLNVPENFDATFISRHLWKITSIYCDSKEECEKHLHAINAIREKYTGWTVDG